MQGLPVPCDGGELLRPGHALRTNSSLQDGDSGGGAQEEGTASRRYVFVLNSDFLTLHNRIFGLL